MDRQSYKSTQPRGSPVSPPKASSEAHQSQKTTQKESKSPSPPSPACSLKDAEPSALMLMGSNESMWYEAKVVKAIDILGVRVCPAVVKFNNTFENQTYTETVSVQNISDIPVTVRIHNPRAWSFRLVPLDRGYRLAPGLKVSRHIHYTCTKSGMVHSTLPIYINEDIFELPLEAYKGQAFVEIIPTTIKFGRVDIGCKPVERKILIKNVSFCATKFLVDVASNELDLHVGPMKGWIRPHSTVTLVLQLLALREGVHSSELWITTDLCQTRIQVEVEACRRNLMALHPNNISDFTLVDFPTTFYGCHRYQTLVVYNMAASSSAFVVLADFGSKGQVPFREAKKGNNHHVKMFDVEPVEGRIMPFEQKIFTFWFNPQIIEGSRTNGWKSDNIEDIGDVNDYLCAVRIKRIQVDDVGGKPALGVAMATDSTKNTGPTIQTSSPSNSNPDVAMDKELEEGEESLMNSALLEEISVLVYLYGEAEVPSLSAIPDELHFPNTPVGSTVVKVIHLTNITNHMLAFQYRKIPFFEVIPDFKKLAPKITYDVTVRLCARNIGVLKRNLIFEILAQGNATDKQDFQVISQVTVRIFGEVKSQKIVPEPKFNPGITPLITNEVGFLTDEVTYASKIEKPRSAVTAKAQRGRPWHQTDAIIAFPNDRPLTLRPRPTDAKAKTIYKGLARYVAPVDESLTYTLEKLIKKKAHDDWFLNYIRGTAALSISKDHCCKWRNPKIEHDPPLVLFEAKEANLPREVFVPLTFVQLYRIRVYPPIISFGSVTTSKSCTQQLSIENANNFKISVRIMPLTSGINIQTLKNFIISENTDAKIMLTFQRETLGRYSGTVTCIINGFHSFDIAVVAEVVHRSLNINPECVEIKVPDIPFANTFVPIAINNPLNIPITFSWVFPEESPIKIEPVIGVTPKRGSVWCVVFFEPESPNFKLHPIKLMVDGTVCLKLKTGVVLPKTDVYFLEAVLNVGYIPMNLTTVRRFFIFNPNFSDAMFVVLNKEPIKGVKVKPSSGTVRAKSCHSLTLSITVPTEKALDFPIYITLQNSTTIEMRVAGNVVYPEVEVTPQYINLHRVPCNSVTRTMLMAENKSKAKAEVSFEMNEYPQFKVSLSKRHNDPGLSSRGFSLEPGAAQKFYLHFIPKDLASYDFYLPIVINNLFTPRSNTSKEMESQGKFIKDKVRGISLCEKNRRNSVGGVMSHLVLVDVVVLKASLIISDLELFFSSTSETKSFSVKNTSEQPSNIIFRSEDFPSHFVCHVYEGEVIKDRSSFRITVDPGDSITFVVTFTGTSPGLHVSDVSILTAVEELFCVYNMVRLTGSIPLPCIITSSVEEVYFHPVPLNVDVSLVFQLKVSHHQQDKETVIASDLNNTDLELFTIEYPNGNSVAGITKCLVPVKITFRCSFPVSLRKRISFRGSNRSGECFVNLIATADNCLLTTHAFLKVHSPNQPRLALEEVVEKPTLMSNEKGCSPLQQMMKLPSMQANISSSGGSKASTLSLNTIGSASQPARKNKSIHQSRITKLSGVGEFEKEKPALSSSDIQLSLELSEKEERLPSRIESLVMTDTVTKEDELMFPMFPTDQAVSENALYMKKTLDSVQQWVYEQVFCCSYYAFFGSHSFSSFSLGSKKEYSPTSSMALRNVFDVLERICGRRIRRYFTPIDKLPEENPSKAMFTYNLYRQLVDFMEVQGALMAHVEPKYLLAYDDYCAYHKAIPVTDRLHELLSTGSQFSDCYKPPEIMSAENFFSISVQCWLDLFLQMFKTLVLGPTVGISYYVPHESVRRLTVTSRDASTKNTVYGRAEEILLTWLTHQFNGQRTAVWPNKPPPSRTVTNFNMDLEDGLVLTAATAAYCPYLNQIHFQDMCLQPTTISQAYHNTTCLCMAWDSIKLGFSITPRDFVQPNTIKMLLLVTHLYKVLPSYKPEATITFRAILNASESQIVMLKNDEEVNITYHIEILPNTANFFLEDDQDSFMLKRKSKGQISVRYLARNTNKAEAILLLCGACMPPKFGRNYVFKLEGFPVKLPVSSSFNIISPQSTPLDTHITVESPHVLDFKADESYSYDLWIAFTEPQPGNLNAMSWAKERVRKIPRRLFFTTNTLVVSANKKKVGSGVLAFKVCCFSQIVCNFWLIFRNPEIGDFIVKLQVTPRKPDPVINLQVMMDQETKCGCLTDRTFNCSRSTTVLIPCRNLEQWSAVRTMFELTTSAEEKEFWSAYIESNIGFRLLQWMLEEKKEKLNEELEVLFKKSKTYKVSCLSKYITCTPTIYIPDVRSNTSLPIELHFDEATPSHSTVLTLTSIEGHEMRSYNLKVVINSRKPSYK